MSEPQQAAPNRAYMRWLQACESSELAITVLTYGELVRGVSVLEPGRRRTELNAWLAEALTFFGDRILPIDVGVATVWANLWLAHRRLGRPVGVIDELIAATALAHGLTVVTRNVRHFESSGCQLINPWSG